MRSLCFQIIDQFECRYQNRTHSLAHANDLVTKLYRYLKREEKLSVYHHYRPLAYIFQLSRPFFQLHRRIAKFITQPIFNEWIFMDVFASDFSWESAYQYYQWLLISYKNNSKRLFDSPERLHLRQLLMHCLATDQPPLTAQPTLITYVELTYRVFRHCHRLLRWWINHVWPFIAIHQMKAIYPQLVPEHQQIALTTLKYVPFTKAIEFYAYVEDDEKFFSALRQLGRCECELLLQQQGWAPKFRQWLVAHSLIQLTITKTSPIVLHITRLTSYSTEWYCVYR